MQDLALGKQGESGPVLVSAAIQSHFFLLTCLGLAFVNVLTFAYHLTGSNIFNLLSNVTSLLLISYSIYLVLLAGEDSNFYKIIFACACAFVGASFLANYGEFQKTDALKYLSIYAFYIAGRSAPARMLRAEKWCIFALAALPLIFSLIGRTKVYVGWEYPDVFAYFPNTNTAALYFSALFFSVSPLFGNKVLVLQFVNAALMNRVGAALATIFAIGLWSVFPLRKQVFVVLSGLALAGVLGYALGAFYRVTTALENLALIWSLNPATVARMTYGQLVELTGTTDLSAFFRVIHWTNIWGYYSTQGLGTILFGYGAGQTSLVAYTPMPPHNDYLRVLVEYGLLSFLLFVFFVVRIAISIKMQAAKILFTVLLLYFLSENLMDNLTSMALFFAYAGRFTSGSRPGSAGA